MSSHYNQTPKLSIIVLISVFLSITCFGFPEDGQDSGEESGLHTKGWSLRGVTFDETFSSVI